jgi:DNA-binding MarR family transcriptional regulator
MPVDDWSTAVGVLRASSQLVDGIQAGLARRGFADIRPVHGFVFAALSSAQLSSGPLTTAELATELSISKQASAQLVEHLVRQGYLTRQADPNDGRAWRLVLTTRGHRCTQAAAEAAADAIARWRQSLPPTTFTGFARTLATIAEPGPLRPAW